MDNHAGNFDNSLRWLAGLIDSDGCFSISRSLRKNNRVVYTPSIVITNSNVLILESVHELLKELNINHHIKNNGSCKNIVINRPNIIVSLGDFIKDGLLVKSAELDLLGSFCRSRISNVNEFGCNWKAKYTDYEFDIANKLRRLNVVHYGVCEEFGIKDGVVSCDTLERFSLHWLAGFIDGDGCITINKIKRSNGTFQYQPMVHIVTGSPVAKSVISTFLDRYNVNYYLKKQIPGKRHKPNCKCKKFEFYIRSFTGCLTLCELLENKIVGKSRQCTCLTEFCQSRMSRPNSSYNKLEISLHDQIKKFIKDTSTTTSGAPTGEDIV